MAILVISTWQGATHEVEVRDIHDAEREMARFSREYMANHPNDRIVDASVVSRGGIVSRWRDGRLEDF